MNNLSEVLVKDGANFKLKSGVLKLYIHQKYIDTNYTIVEGSVVKSIGLLPYRWYKNLSDADADKPASVGTLNIPSYIDFFPQDIDSGKDVLIYPQSYSKPYTIMEFGDGYKCFPNGIIKDLDNVCMFQELMLDGRMDDNIPYDKLSTAWIMNSSMNSVGLGVPATVICTIIRELCRDRHNPDKRFSEVIAKQKTPCMIGYVFASLRELSASSVFGGISFEDLDYMLDIGLNMTKEEKEQNISPVEDILKL